MKVEYINPFITATVNALETMAFIKPERKDPYMKEDGKATGDISGLIGLAGQTTGSVAISFPREMALKVVSNMVGEEMKEFNNEVRDGVGEIANMIAGGAKGELSEKGYHFKLSIPTVVIGSSHNISHRTDVPCIVVPFRMEDDTFTIEISLKMEKET